MTYPTFITDVKEWEKTKLVVEKLMTELIHILSTLLSLAVEIVIVVDSAVGVEMDSGVGSNDLCIWQ